MSANSSPPAASQDKNSASSNRTASGGSSPTKNAKARTSPMKTHSPKTPSSVSAKKTTRAALQNKSAEDLCGQILELKKTLSSANDEKNGLKAKVRRLEEDNNKKSESEKNATNSIINNLKRKIQRLETTLKDKENVIKKLQNDAKVAKQSANKRAPETPNENSAGKRPPVSPQESTRPTPTKNHTLYKTPTGRRATPGKGQDQNAAIVEETKQLKCWLRRALGIDPTSGKYEEMSKLELTAEIQKLTEELRLHHKIHEIGSLQDPPSDWKAKEVIAAEELEKLKSELVKLKEDRVEYYCAMENKDAELTRVTEELKKAQKDRTDGKERLERNRPGTFVRKPSTQPGPGSKTSSGKTTEASTAPHKPSPQKAGAHPAIQKSSVTGESLAKRVTNGKSRMNATTTITKQTSGITKSTTITIKKTLKTKQTVPETPGCTIAEASKVDVSKDDGKARVSPEEVESFRENLAAKKIQKTWKQHQTKDQKLENTEHVDRVADEDALRSFQENRAAKVIQKGWKESRGKTSPDKDLDEAVITIQATARGHSERSEHLVSMKGGSGDSLLINRNGDADTAPDDDLDTSATVIQAAARAHHAREEMLQQWEGTNGNGDVLRKSVPS